MALHAVPLSSYDDPRCLSIFRIEVGTKNNGEKETDGAESDFNSVQRLPGALQYFSMLYRNPFSQQHTFIFHIQLQKYGAKSKVSKFCKCLSTSLMVYIYDCLKHFSFQTLLGGISSQKLLNY